MNATTYNRSGTASQAAGRELVGKVASITFHDAESGATIARLSNGSTVKGDADQGALETGIQYRFLGRWTDNVRWGKQFHFETYVVDQPHDKRGVIAYLCREVDGIGQAIAGQLWEAYGPAAVETLRTDPQRVATDGHLGEVDAQRASQTLRDLERFEKTRIDLFSLFAGRGFSKVAVKACIEAWGVRAADVVRRNPFTLLVREVPSAGFKRCDRLYLELGGDPAKLKRQMLAGWDALREGLEGNTWHPYGAFRAAVVKCIGATAADLSGALSLGLRAGWLRTIEDDAGNHLVAEAGKAANEERLARKIRELREANFWAWPLLTTSAVSPHQAGAFNPLHDESVILLTGTPGTGKTYTAAALLKACVDQVGAGAVAVAAPTGKASVRITDAMSRYGLSLTATTIHQLLRIGRNGHDGKGWGFLHDESNPLPYRVVAIDEASMLDTDLAADLFAACATGTKVLLIGDPNQLPPVGHGAPLRDLIAAGVPCATLTEIQRNSGMIVQACASIKDGRRFVTADRLDESTGANLRLIEAKDEEQQLAAVRAVVEAVRASGKIDPVWDLQFLTPLNEKSRVARVPLNELLQGILNPPAENAADLQVGEFRLHDKIICLRNCMLGAQELTGTGAGVNGSTYAPRKDENGKAIEVYLANGDLGRVEAVRVDEKALYAQFSHPPRLVRIPVGKKDDQGDAGGTGAGKDFGLAYAITGHKSQGSEWPMVVVVVDEAAGAVACREWIYTAISRAKTACLMIGKRAVADRQCQKVSLTRRKTFLKELLSCPK